MFSRKNALAQGLTYMVLASAGVKAGEELLVTERGKPIAKIVPLRTAGGDEEKRLSGTPPPCFL